MLQLQDVLLSLSLDTSLLRLDLLNLGEVLLCEAHLILARTAHSSQFYSILMLGVRLEGLGQHLIAVLSLSLLRPQLAQLLLKGSNFMTACLLGPRSCLKGLSSIWP